MGLCILFGVPTIVLVYIYISLGINSYWQLFLFSFMAMVGYMPGALILCMLQAEWIRNEVKNSLSDFDRDKQGVKKL